MASTSESNQYRMSNAFEFHIGSSITPGFVVAGRFLGTEATRALELLRAGAEPSLTRLPPPPALSLAFASSGQKIIIHNNNNTNTAKAKKSAKQGEVAAMGASGSATSAHNNNNNNNEGAAALQTLSFGKEPSALGVGRQLLPSTLAGPNQRDVLLFGAPSSVLAYDVEQNKQLFYKEVEDGVQAVVCGSGLLADCEDQNTALTIVGGNCSIFGFDASGTERYWTVTGDQVSAMALLPWTTTSSNPSLLVASDDFCLRVFQGEEAVLEMEEVDRVRHLIPHHRLQDHHPGVPGRFAYLLENGTVGVYEGGERVWRVKGKSTPVAAAFCDVDGDGVEELVVGWSNGRVEVRAGGPGGSGGAPQGMSGGGEVLYRETYATPVAAVLAEDYQQDGKKLPLVCTVDGSVRGLTLLETRREEAMEARQLQALETLVREQQTLAAQLTSLEEQLRRQATGERDATLPEAGLQVVYNIFPNPVSGLVDIVFALQQSDGALPEGRAVIQSCLLQSESWSAKEEGGRAFALPTPSSYLVCPVVVQDHHALSIHALVTVGTPFSEHYQVHEVVVEVPAFAMYIPPEILEGLWEHYDSRRGPGQTPVYVEPAGAVTLSWQGGLRAEAVEGWLRRAFSLHPDFSLAVPGREGGTLLRLVHAHGGSSLGIEVQDDPDGTRSRRGCSTLTIRTESLAVAAAVVGAMEEGVEGGFTTEPGRYPVDVSCQVEQELTRLRAVLQRVEEFNAVRGKLTTDMADAATIVKTLLLRAEDARVLGDVPAMKKAYAALYDVDQELMGENEKRIKNVDELKLALRDVSAFIQQAGKVRLGPARGQLVADCRTALKEERTTALLNIVRTGKE